jgi:hypothetical protein
MRSTITWKVTPRNLGDDRFYGVMLLLLLGTGIQNILLLIISSWVTEIDAPLKQVWGTKLKL